MKSIFVLFAMVISSHALAADPAQGQVLYTNRCAMCHGPAGVSAAPNFPNVAGQKEGYLFQQLKDFKEGRRAGAMMPAMVKDLSDADFANVSAFLSSLKGCVNVE